MNKRLAAFFAVVAVVSLAAWMLILHFYALPRFRRLELPKRLPLAVFCLLFGTLLVFSLDVKAPPHPVLLPDRTLQVFTDGTSSPLSGGSEVGILFFKTSFGEVYRLPGSQGWNAEQIPMFAAGVAEATWQGNPGDNAVLVFRSSPAGGQVRVVWDGQETVYDLYSGNEGEVYSNRDFQLPLWYRVLALGLDALFCSALVFLVALVFAGGRRAPVYRPVGWRVWIGFALPMLAVWGVYLLAFWPGIMSGDSTGQWWQAVYQIFEDTHPVFHTFFLWASYRLTGLPVVAIVLQMIGLAVTLAWGLGALMEWGLSRRVAWILASGFALSLVNGLYAVTLWKDIPYSIAVLGLGIVCIKVATSGGNWLGRASKAALLVVLVLLALLLRHNGVTVGLGTLALLLFFYRRWWKSLGLVFALAVGVWLLWSGPVTRVLNVMPSPVTTSMIPLHGIGAYIAAGTLLEPEEVQYINRILELEKWDYRCWNHQSIISDPEIRYQPLVEDKIRPWQIYLTLIGRQPVVTLNHLLCSSGLVWRTHWIYDVYKSPLWQDEDGVHWITPNPAAPPEHSLFSQAAALIYKLYAAIDEIPLLNDLVWRPGVSLFLLVFCLVAAAFRFGQPRIMLFGVPALLQSATMMAISLTQEFRYQYGVALTAWLLVALLLIPGEGSGGEEETE